MKHSINLIVGDWSHDGRGLTKTIHIKSNLTAAELKKAYKAGERKVKIDLVGSVCRDYGDYRLRSEVWKKLHKAGLTLEDLDVWGELERNEEYEIEVDVHAFAAIYLFIAGKGNPALDWEFEENDSPNSNIGGYGLFLD